MPDWWSGLFSQITGPYGVIVVLCIVIFFLWKLFREAQAEAKSSQAAVGALTQGIKDMTLEMRAKREAGERS